jgi:hypothetical protein
MCGALVCTSGVSGRFLPVKYTLRISGVSDREPLVVDGTPDGTGMYEDTQQVNLRVDLSLYAIFDQYRIAQHSARAVKRSLYITFDTGTMVGYAVPWFHSRSRWVRRCSALVAL